MCVILQCHVFVLMQFYVICLWKMENCVMWGVLIPELLFKKNEPEPEVE